MTISSIDPNSSKHRPLWPDKRDQDQVKALVPPFLYCAEVTLPFPASAAEKERFARCIEWRRANLRDQTLRLLIGL